jgi:hypothetical protein
MKLINLYSKISLVPDDLKAEVNEFVDALLKRNKKEPGDKKPKFGCAKGQITMSPDFDAPLDDFKEYM